MPYGFVMVTVMKMVAAQAVVIVVRLSNPVRCVPLMSHWMVPGALTDTVHLTFLKLVPGPHPNEVTNGPGSA